MDTYRKRATSMVALGCGALTPAGAAGRYGMTDSESDGCGPGVVSSRTFCAAV
jgi:hypothetical protein